LSSGSGPGPLVERALRVAAPAGRQRHPQEPARRRRRPDQRRPAPQRKIRAGTPLGGDELRAPVRPGYGPRLGRPIRRHVRERLHAGLRSQGPPSDCEISGARLRERIDPCADKRGVLLITRPIYVTAVIGEQALSLKNANSVLPLPTLLHWHLLTVKR